MKSNTLKKLFFGFALVLITMIGMTSVMAAAPVVNSITTSPATPTFNNLFRLTAHVTDADGGFINVSFTVVSPNGTTIMDSGFVSINPGNLYDSNHSNASDVGVFQYTVTATDNTSAVGTGTGNFTIPNTNPTLTPPPPMVFNEDSNLTYDLSALKADNEDPDSALTWTLTNLNATLFTATVQGDILTLVGEPNMHGNGAVRVILHDTDGGNDSFDTPVTVNAVPDAPVITTTADTSAYFNETYTYDVNADDADGDVLTYSGTFPAGMTINSTTGVITWIPNATGTNPVTVVASDGTLTDNQTYTLTVTNRPRLEIDKLTAYVDGKSDTVTDGDKIGKDAVPGSDVSFKFKMANLYTDDEDVEIQDVEIKVTIYDIDDGDDLEEEAPDFDIRADDTETVTIDFELPMEVEEDDFLVDIEIDAEDEDGNLISIDWTLTLELNKETHEVVLTRVSISPNEVTCSRSTGLDINGLNIGSKDEDETVLTVISTDLGINVKERYELEEGVDDDNGFSKYIPIDVSSTLKAGTYPIYIKLYYDDTKLSDSEIAYLVVKDCSSTNNGGDTGDTGGDTGGSGTDGGDTDVIFDDGGTSGTGQSTTSTTTTTTISKNAMMFFFLVAANIIGLALVIFLFAVVFKN